MISQIASAVTSGGGGPDFSSLLNMVPTPGQVTIIPLMDIGGPVPIPAGPIYSAMFNPDSWDEKYQYVYCEVQEPGTQETVHRFRSSPSNELNFKLLIDGTGASGVKKNVTENILLLRATVGYDGRLHQTRPVVIVWGFFFFKGYIQTLDIHYKLFSPDGKPLRAEVTLSFSASTDPVSRVLQSDPQSADLTHTRQIKAGDRLDNLCNSIYGAPRFNLEVAKANDLTTIRKLPLGQTFVFPPLEK